MSTAAVYPDDDLPDGHLAPEAHRDGVVGEPSPPDQPSDHPVSPMGSAAGLADALLLIFADALDMWEHARIATLNQIRALREVKQMADTPVERRLVALADAVKAMEHGAELELKRAIRTHPLGPWIKTTVGVGEKQGARLLAAIGNPYLRHDGTARTVSQLWAYCGYHVLHPGQAWIEALAPRAGVDPSAGSQPPGGTHSLTAAGSPSSDPGHRRSEIHTYSAGVAPRRQKGHKANWNNTAKMRAYLVADAAIAAGIRKLPGCDDSSGYNPDGREAVSPLGEKYLARRRRTAETHPDWPDLHSHNDALRIVAKEVLKSMWVEARRIHEQAT